MNDLTIGFLYMAMAQVLVWFQSYGQFIYPKFKENPFVVSLIFGTSASYMFIKSVQHIAAHFKGELWPARFLGQATGMVIFAFMTWILMDEGLNTKTLISLGLAAILICVQLFWK
jgi:multidrug transporter EmrE-like cation transporter